MTLATRLFASPQPLALGLDEALALLGNPRRRRLLEFVYAEETTTLRAASEHLAALEYGHDYDAAERKAIWVVLYQDHVPRLDDAGLLAYSHDEIAATDQTEAAVDALQALREHTDGGASA